MQLPDSLGHYGPYGGKFVPETLMPALAELESAYAAACADPQFQRQFDQLCRDYVGRPTPLYHAQKLSDRLGGAQILLKREDLAHTGAHKINNSLGQSLLTLRMGKRRVIAETGAGQHGVAVATTCAMLGLECVVYMGEVDVHRQSLNVFRMKLLGAEVRPVSSGSRTLKDAINEAIRDWVTNVGTTHYLLGSVVGPHPYPMIVRDFQSIIGRETRQQVMESQGRLPDCIIACVGGGSNAIGIFHEFVGEPDIKLIGVEAATLVAGSPGVLHGAKSYLLQDAHGQVLETRSIAPGLDYPGTGPEHSYHKDTGRITYVAVADDEALEGFQLLSRVEGIIPALEPSHAIAYAARIAPEMNSDRILVINLSGRGDKDISIAAEALGIGL